MRKIVIIAVSGVLLTTTGFIVYKKNLGRSPIWVDEASTHTESEQGTERSVSKNHSKGAKSADGDSNVDRRPAEEAEVIGYPIQTSEKAFPESGQAVVYKLERPAVKSEKVEEGVSSQEQVTEANPQEGNQFFTKDLKGETTVYKPKDEKNVTYVKVTLKKGLPNGVENSDLPGFKIETNDQKQIKTVSIVGELSNPKMQKAWEKVGREVIQSVFKARLTVSKNVPQATVVKTERISARVEDHDLDLSQDIKVMSWSEYIKKEDSDAAKNQNRAPASVLSGAPTLSDFSNWNAQERAKSLTKLVKQMDQDGNETVAQIEKHMRSRSDSKFWSFGTNALASTRNPDAQKTLIGFLTKSGTTTQQKQQVLTAIATNPQHMSSEAEAELLKIVKQSKGDTKKAAMSAFGAGIRGSQDEAQRIQLEAKIIGMAKEAKTTEEEIALLEAIGSSGSEAFIPIIMQKLKSSNETVRVKATYAMRFMSDDESDDALDEAEDDASLKVKKMAASVREFQKKREKSPHLVAGFTFEE